MGFWSFPWSWVKTPRACSDCSHTNEWDSFLWLGKPEERSYWRVSSGLSEKAMAPHSSILAWKIPWMEEPGRVQSMGSLRVRHDWVTSLSLSCIGEGNSNPLQCSCLENPRNGGAWWAAVHVFAQSWKQLKWLSSSRSSLWVIYGWFLFELSEQRAPY